MATAEQSNSHESYQPDELTLESQPGLAASTPAENPWHKTPDQLVEEARQAVKHASSSPPNAQTLSAAADRLEAGEATTPDAIAARQKAADFLRQKSNPSEQPSDRAA